MTWPLWIYYVFKENSLNSNSNMKYKIQIRFWIGIWILNNYILQGKYKYKWESNITNNISHKYLIYNIYWILHVGKDIEDYKSNKGEILN